MAGQNRSNFNSDFIGDRSSTQYKDNMLHKQMHDTGEEGYERPYKVYVGNLPQEVTQGDIITVFTRINTEAKNVHLAKDKESDTFKGYCYVEFDEVKDLQIALDNNGLILNDREIKINLANKVNRGGRGGRGGPGGQSGYNRQSNSGNSGHQGHYNQGRGSYNQDRGGQMSHRGGNRGNYNDRGGNFGGQDRGYHQGGYSGGHEFNNRMRSQQSDFNQGSFNQPRDRVQRLGPANDEEMAVENKQAYNESLKGRKKLVLMPRTKKSDSTDSVAQRSSIFGTGKAKDHNVETTSKEQ